MSVHETATGCGYAWLRASRSSALIGAFILALCAALPQAGAVVIEADSATLSTTGYTTTNPAPGAYELVSEPNPATNTFRTQLNGLPAGTKVLVIANFSAQGSGTATWRLVMNGVTPGHELTMAAGTAYPFVTSVVHLFEGVSGTNTFELQVKLDSGSPVTTFGGNLLAVPLVTVEDDVLNGAIDGPTTGPGMTNTSLTAIAGASVSVDLPDVGDILVVAMFSGVNTTDAEETSSWQLYSDTGADYLGRQVRHRMANTGTRVAGGLVAITDELPAGTHTFSLHQATTDGTLASSQVVLIAVSLTLEDGRRFAAFPHTDGPLSGASDTTLTDVLWDDFTLQETSDVLVASTFYVDGNGVRDASFRVGVTPQFSQTGQVSTQAAHQVAMASTMGLFEDLSATDHRASLQFRPSHVVQMFISEASLVTILLNTEASEEEGEGAIDIYRAYLHTWDNRTILDTCRARSIGEARAAFEARHIGARIVSITHIKNARRHGYELYLGGARTADRRNIKDTCWARNPAQARYIIGDRYPGGIVNHMGLYYTNRRAVTWYGVTQRVDLFDTLVAGSLHEAFLAFSHRFWREHIVQVLQISNENEFHTYEGTLDPEDLSLVLQAGSAEKAVAKALAAHPRCQVASVLSHHAKDGVTTYEAMVHAEDGRSLRDTVSARSVAEAQKVLRHRYGPGSYAAADEIDWDDGYALFEAGISSAGEQSFTDATFAKTSASAHAILKGRYPQGTVGSASPVISLGGYREYQGTINTADGRNVLDTCWAENTAAARKVFAARFADGQVRSVSAFGNNRLDEFDVVLKAETTRERCEARDKAEAYRILATRFPRTRIVTVRLLEEVPEQSVFRATLNTPDHRTIVDTVEAKTTSEARRLFLERHPGSRFTSLQRMTAGRVDETYQARVDLPPAKDTCQASSPSEARLIFQARYPRGSTGGLRTILRGG